MSLNYNEARKILGVALGASLEEIKKKRDILALKFHPDKALGGCTKLKPGEKVALGCGKGDRGKTWFCSEKHKKAFEKAEEKIKELNEAYDILTGKNSPPDNSGQPKETCDYCEGKYDFEREHYNGSDGRSGWKEFRKKNGETITFHFCNKQGKGGEGCYKNFFFCCVCENKRTKGNTWDKIRRKRGRNVFFCSDDCQKKFEGGDFDHDDHSEEQDCGKCDQCEGDFRRDEDGVKIKWYIGRDKSRFYCSEKCANEWIASKRKRGQREGQEGEEDTSESPSSDAIINRGEENEENETDNGNGSDIPSFDSDNHSHDHSQGDNDFNLSLIQSQAKAEQEVEKIIKDNSISKEEEKELSKEICSGENWKDYLKKLDTSAKVAEFTNKVRNFALKKKLSRQTPTQDKKPENGWVLPVIISVISILALTTALILIIRKRRQKSF